MSAACAPRSRNSISPTTPSSSSPATTAASASSSVRRAGAATGVKPGAEIVFDGESLLPLLIQKDLLQRDTLHWHYPHYHPGGATPYSALRSGDWKLLLFHEDDRLELYNLRRDPGETLNLAEAEADIALELREQLQTWLTQVNAQLPEPNPDHDPERVWESPKPQRKKG